MGRGLNTVFGIRQEAAYGTYLAPNRFFEINSESLRREQAVLQSNSLRAVGRYPRQRGAVSTRGAAGDVTMELATTGMGLIWANLLGGTPTVAQQGGTIAYLQTHTLGELSSKSLTLQKQIEESVGDFKAFSYPGSKILSATFRAAVDEISQVVLSFDCRDEVDSESAVSASYGTRKVFTFKHGTVKVDGSAVGNVTSAEATITNNLKTDSYYLGSDGRKGEQKDDDFPDMGGTLTAEFEDKTVFYDRFKNDTSADLILQWEGDTIASTYKELLRLTFTDVRFTGETPTAEGPGVIATDIPWTAHYDGSAQPVTIEYMSTDTAV